MPTSDGLSQTITHFISDANVQSDANKKKLYYILIKSWY